MLIKRVSIFHCCMIKAVEISFSVRIDDQTNVILSWFWVLLNRIILWRQKYCTKQMNKILFFDLILWFIKKKTEYWIMFWRNVVESIRFKFDNKKLICCFFVQIEYFFSNEIWIFKKNFNWRWKLYVLFLKMNVIFEMKIVKTSLFLISKRALNFD